MPDSTLCIKEIELLKQEREAVRCRLSHRDMLTLSSLLILQGGVTLEMYFFFKFSGVSLY